MCLLLVWLIIRSLEESQDWIRSRSAWTWLMHDGKRIGYEMRMSSAYKVIDVGVERSSFVMWFKINNGKEKWSQNGTLRYPRGGMRRTGETTWNSHLLGASGEVGAVSQEQYIHKLGNAAQPYKVSFCNKTYESQPGGLTIHYYTPTTNESIVGHKTRSVIIVHCLWQSMTEDNKPDMGQD